MKILEGKTPRIIYALPFAVFGIFHFVGAKEMAGMLAGWPGAELLVYVSGAGMIAAAIAITINKYARLAALLLALELFIMLLTLTVPMLSNPDMMQMAMTNLLKDISLIGGALLIASLLDNNNSGEAIEGQIN